MTDEHNFPANALFVAILQQLDVKTMAIERDKRISKSLRLLSTVVHGNFHDGLHMCEAG